MNNTLRIGTRGSKLALWQANYILSLLKKENPEINFETVIIKTKGDAVLDKALSKIGDKGLFTKELENALINNEIDLAVHSMKDVPTKLFEDLEIIATPERELTNDIIISNKYSSFDELPPGAKVGTSSLRRKAQLFNLNKSLNFVDIRGNVDTRLKKLEDGEYDAIILAYAGVHRLGLDHCITEKLSFETCLPATGQGAVGIEIRKSDLFTKEKVLKINHQETFLCVEAERAFLGKLEGGCQIPIACQAFFSEGKFFIRGLVSDLDGNTIMKEELTYDSEVNTQKAKKAGTVLAEYFIENGALELINSIR